MLRVKRRRISYSMSPIPSSFDHTKENEDFVSYSQMGMSVGKMVTLKVVNGEEVIDDRLLTSCVQRISEIRREGGTEG